MSDLSSAEHLRTVSLEDKYSAETGQVYLTGMQALVRLPLMQKRRDRRAGLNTAGYVSGYRGSPLGTLDDQLGRAASHLQAHDVVFVPGLNEDLAATAVWGTQQAELSGEGRFDGVFAFWYAKGPGVDRSGDALRHANLAGSSRHGGVLVLMGDDHTCESSTTCHQSEFALVDAQMPILSPAGVTELLDYGLLGWALSRHSGCWVGMKCVKDTVESSASVDVNDHRLVIATPKDRELPPDGLNIRQPDTPQAQEYRLVNHKLAAAQAFARANRLDRVVFGRREGARIGIVTAGKSWLDVRQALAELGIDEARAQALGLVVYKVGMVWPLEPEGLADFTLGLDQVVVVEEKRALLEAQLKEILYGRADAPRVIGKKDEDGAKLFPVEMALDAVDIALVLGRRLGADDAVRDALAALERRRTPLPDLEPMTRTPYFCAGCPHNTSTHVPEGSRAYAGIGCSWMAQSMERRTLGYTHMGAEGLSWVGEAPFSRRTHMFQNMGDGTYFHSGLLAIRAAVAAGTNITFKILFNDAVAMTGGQRHDGPLDPGRISRQVHAEGVERIALVSDDIVKYDAAVRAGFAPGVSFHPRDELDAVQRALREVPGATALIYDQTCAAEKRRRRKKGAFPDPDMRLFINEMVCEGCGDCGVQSNCVALLPVETPFGRKRAIDQSSCNKDYSCLKGFCPSFVTVRGAKPRKGRSGDLPDIDLPEPALPALEGGYGMVVTGVGGTGVITIGALLGMAAHLEGKGVGVLDMVGMAQKGGSVWTHLRFGRTPADIAAVRVAPASADFILGCDLVVTASAKTLDMARTGRTRVLANSREVMPGEFTRRPDLVFPGQALLRNIARAVGADHWEAVDASALATTLCGDSIATNLFMLGLAYQRGQVPVGAAAIERAIGLNGAAVGMNTAAFRWGRAYALQPVFVRDRATSAGPDAQRVSESAPVDPFARYRAHLTDYQNERYATRFQSVVDAAIAAERRLAPGETKLAEAVARSFFRLMAYKDEYEVARLYASSEFRRQISAAFEGQPRLAFNLAPPGLSRTDQRTGRPAKREFGAWVLPVFGVLSRLRVLRGSWLDPFGHSAERRMERGLIEQYERDLLALLETATPAQWAWLVEFAAAAQQVRGFGPVKQASVRTYAQTREALLARRPA